MDEIPRDIQVAVRAAAEAPQDYKGELSTVFRRARRRRARRRATAAAAAFTVLAGLAGGGFALRQRTDAMPLHEPASPVPAQRLLLPGADGIYVAAQGDPSPVHLGDAAQIGELSVDDHLLTHQVVGGGRYTTSIGLPDGRLVSMGPRGAAPPHGEMLLTVETPGGQTQQRDVTSEDEPVSLAAADATTAYLWRPYGLYARELAGGLERLVISSDMLELPDSDPAGGLDAADVGGDRLVIADQDRSCRPLLTSIAPPQGLRFLPLTALGCTSVTGLRLSPAALRVAVTYRAKGASRVAVLSTEDGRVLADREVATAKGGAAAATVEVAWTDDRTVRGVVVPTGGKEVHTLRQFTVVS
ncbi:hypothetical protein [Actinoplanes sp. M2I2]|uniref:hypothetical protein n=1 Tax=Actinoplanes sp. M2I2 TaxID=1734444 RepID=UPI0020228749|nr:hypothetical protein [Actinoplanes sp. M2I2]